MALDYTKIPQTSRTIVFEEFNSDDDVGNLCVILEDRDTAEALSEVEEKLCVKSFKEFKEKFKPTIYEEFQTDSNGGFTASFSLKKLSHNSIPVNICEHEFYKAVHDIAMEKSASNTNNNKIDYTKLNDTFSPESIYKTAEQNRRSFQQCFNNALEADANGDMDGRYKWLAKAKMTRDSVIHEYSGDALRLLPIAIKDIDTILQRKGITPENEKLTEAKADTPDMLPCRPVWTSEGELKLEPLDEYTPEAIPVEAKKNDVLQITQRQWEQAVDMIPAGYVNKDVFLSVYSQKKNSELIKLPAEQLISRKKAFCEMYLSAQQSFCEAAGTLVQKVASLEQFFIHAGDDNGIVENGVIISNCSVSQVLSDKYREGVKKFLKASANIESEKIWFAILPPIVDKNNAWVETLAKTDNHSDTFDFDLNSFEEVMGNSANGKVTAADINNITEMLAECEILSFVNFNACVQTSFKNFGADTEIIKEYNKELSALKRKDSTVLAYPNFTIIPQNKRNVDLFDNRTLYTPSVYINAAYVAAGIVVATQTPEIQKKKFGKKVKDGRPFVRFDLEEEVNSAKFAAKFNPESRLNMDRETAAFIRGKEGNAFCFRSDSLKNNAFVFTARTRDARPIYCYLTKTYLKYLFERTYAQTSDKAKRFARDISNEISNQADGDFINPILYSNERFEYSDGKFSLEFNSFNNTLGTVEIEVKELDN